MPITAFQKKVLKLIKANRSPDSYVAGGTAIQRAPDSLRFSDDIDFFHDTDKAVTDAFQRNRDILLLPNSILKSIFYSQVFTAQRSEQRMSNLN